MITTPPAAREKVVQSVGVPTNLPYPRRFFVFFFKKKYIFFYFWYPCSNYYNNNKGERGTKKQRKMVWSFDKINKARGILRALLDNTIRPTDVSMAPSALPIGDTQVITVTMGVVVGKIINARYKMERGR